MMCDLYSVEFKLFLFNDVCDHSLLSLDGESLTWYFGTALSKLYLHKSYNQMSHRTLPFCKAKENFLFSNHRNVFCIIFSESITRYIKEAKQNNFQEHLSVG